MQIHEWCVAADRALFLLINHTLANPVFDVVFTNATEAKFWIVPAIIAAVLFALKKRKQAFIVLGLALLTVAITDQFAGQVLKPLFHRDRPCPPGWFIEGGRFLSGSKHSYSFPSSHAMNMFAQATLLSFFYPRRTWIFATFACFIGYSRIYVGVHYPADVAGGAVFGIVIAIGVVVAYRMVRARWERSRSKNRMQTSGHASTEIV